MCRGCGHLILGLEKMVFRSLFNFLKNEDRWFFVLFAIKYLPVVLGTSLMFNPDMIGNIMCNTNNYARWKMESKRRCRTIK